MARNGVTAVDEVWKDYAYGIKPHGADLTRTERIASEIMNGKKDPTNGATHFYSSTTMPDENPTKEELAKAHTGGGLESVPEIVDDGGNPIRNYRPFWGKDFRQEPVDGVPQSAFKFFRQEKPKHVR